MNFTDSSIKIINNNKNKLLPKESLQLEWDYENPCVK